MNLQFVRYFLTLSQTKNFSRAAEKMNVVQSTFSAGIKKLEEQLDVQLFYRDKRNVRLTPEGEQLLGMAKDLMDAWNRIEITFNHLENKELTVGLLKNILMEAVIPKFNRFKAQFPQYSIRIREGDAGELKTQLKTGELDCAIVKEDSMGDPALSYHFLYEERLMLTLPPNHALAKRSKISVRELAGLPFIQRSSCTLYDEVYSRLETEGIAIEPVFASDNDEVVKGLVSSGVGVALMSKPQREDGQLVHIPFQDAEFVSNIVVCWNKENQKRGLESFLRL